MERQLPITRARHELTSLPERLAADQGAIAITRWGEPVLALMPWDFYESLLETLEVLADRDLMEALRRSLEEAERGDVIPWETVATELDL